MKGTIPKCLEEMVRARHGEASWAAVRAAAGLPKWHSFLTTEDIADHIVIELFAVAARTLGQRADEVMEDFGIYWSTTYAPDIYGVFFRRAANARELILAMSDIHRDTTKRVANATPPHFEYRWTDERTLVMSYRSKRGLAGLMPGLLRGVGQCYGERLNVTGNGDDMTIRFPDVPRA